MEDCQTGYYNQDKNVATMSCWIWTSM